MKKVLSHSSTAQKLAEAASHIRDGLAKMDSLTNKRDALSGADMPAVDRAAKASRYEWEIGKIEDAVNAASQEAAKLLAEYRGSIGELMSSEREELFAEFLGIAARWFPNASDGKVFEQTAPSRALFDVRYNVMTIYDVTGPAAVLTGIERAQQCVQSYEESGSFLPEAFRKK